MARAIKINPDEDVNNGGLMAHFSSRGPLLELIYELHSFSGSELLARYRGAGIVSTDSDDSILDYLDQLAQINVLKCKGGIFFVQPFLRD